MGKRNQKVVSNNSFTEFLLYTTPNGKVKVEIFLQDENIWLTQKRIAALFDAGVNTINYHLKEIFRSAELSEKAVIRKIRITADDGKKYETNFYNLDAIISVGYRVNSLQATQFRIWATERLKEYIIKGCLVSHLSHFTLGIATEDASTTKIAPQGLFFVKKLF